LYNEFKTKIRKGCIILLKTKKYVKVIFLTFLIALILSINVFADVWFTESHSITQTNSSYWQSVTFGSTICNPIVLMGPPSYNGTDPCTVRVRNVTNSGFQFQIDEWNYLDGGHVEEDVDSLYLDDGSQFINGLQIEAGKITIDEKWATIPLEGKFDDTPVIIAQCTSYEGSDAVSVRIRNVTTESFDIRLQEEEANGDHVFERVDYAAFEQGTYGNFDVKLVDQVTDGWKTISGSANANDAIFMANIQTFNGGDTAALRKDNLTGSVYRIKVEEEQSANSEVGHVAETVGIVSYYK
jgi:hypothetical protein